MSYGEWKSPITLDVVTPDSTEISTAAIDRVTGKLFWRSKKPSGQFVICSGENVSSAVEWTPEGFSAVSRVHEYGGGAFFAHNGEIFFVNKTDQRIYRQSAPEAAPIPVTADFGEGKMRYAEGHISSFLNMIVCVREDHTVEGRECVNSVVAIDLLTGDQHVLAEGADFYKSIDTCGNKIVFVSWMHPNMPWDDTQVSIGELVLEGKVASTVNIKVMHTGASHLQTRLVTEDQYLYLCDRTDFWNVWKSSDEEKPLYKSSNEPGFPFGWCFGYPGYDIMSDGIVIGAKAKDGLENLLLVDIDNPQSVLKDLGLLVRNKGYSFGTYTNILCHGKYVYALGIDDPANPLTLLRISLTDDSVFIYNDEAAGKDLLPYISYAESVEFPTTDSEMNAYGFLYRPKNPDYSPGEQEKPPLLLRVHGGPTGMASRSLNMKTQYFTSRGFAVFDVDYRGSSGYGRAFRQALYGKWGVYDIEDAISAAKHLVSQGIVDGNRLTIDGGSAGGYTTMAMMVFQNYFHAGVSYYGVSDLLGLAKHTHKFESQYLTKMIGKLPEEEAIYKERSPLCHASQLRCPIGFFQGSEDFVCPPPQSQELYNAALENGVATFYVEYEGEGHGFRQAKNIQRCVSNEIYFYSKIFGFKLFDETENPPPIKNLPNESQ